MKEIRLNTQCQCMNKRPHTRVLTRNLMRFMIFGSPGKPCLVKCFKWLLKVIKGQRAGKGHILFLDQSTKGTLEAQRAQCPLVEAQLVHTQPHMSDAGVERTAERV